MLISIVVAIAENGVIGVDGGLPWRLSSDLKRFKRDTMGKVIIMGRKTWESIGKPLPGRANIVITRNPDYVAEGADVVTSLDQAIQLAKVHQRCLPDKEEICIIGGGQLYKEAITLADRLYVTHVMSSPAGDTHFPKIDPVQWQPSSREHFPAGKKDDVETLYVVYDRYSG